MSATDDLIKTVSHTDDPVRSKTNASLLSANESPRVPILDGKSACPGSSVTKNSGHNPTDITAKERSLNGKHKLSHDPRKRIHGKDPNK